MGDSPITIPHTPSSEPPTPTTNHTSAEFHRRNISDKVSGESHPDEDGSCQNSIYAPTLHKSYLSVTSSCFSVKSMGSSIVDTDLESIVEKPQIPMSIESKTKMPLTKFSQHPNDFQRASSSCFSVKSMGSSIVDTDLDSIVSKPQIPTSIESKPISPPKRKSSSVVVEQDEDMAQFLTNSDYNRYNSNDEDEDKEENNNDDNLSNTSFDRGAESSIVQFLTEFKSQIMTEIQEIRSSQHRDTEKLIHLLRNESNRRSIVESRLHAQMLLQAETMVAMEIKLLSLEARLEQKDSERRKLANKLAQRDGDIVPRSSEGNLADLMGASNETIDEEDTDGDSAGFVPGEGIMREIQVTTRSHENANSSNQHRRLPNVAANRGDSHHSVAGHGTNLTSIAVISSGVSLASGVTATSFLEETQGAEDQVGRLTGVKVVTRDDRSARSDDGDVEDNETVDNEEEDDDAAVSYNEDGSASTPTQGHRSFFAEIHPVSNLESILLNPIHEFSSSDPASSTRAVRGDYDGASSLATSATSMTALSTILTTTTRGNSSINARTGSSVNIDEQSQEIDLSTSPNHLDLQSIFGLSGLIENASEDQNRQSRSRSQSPLTVQSEGVASTAQQSLASASVGNSVWSTAAVAPTRASRPRRDLQRIEGRQQWANRVVQFTSDQVFSVPPDISEGGDSITMPDELDNFDVAEDFSNRARVWRMEYEARLDAIHKRFNSS